MPQLAFLSVYHFSTEVIRTEFKLACCGMPGSFWRRIRPWLKPRTALYRGGCGRKRVSLRLERVARVTNLYKVEGYCMLPPQNQRRWASYRVAGDSPHNDGDSRHKDGDSLHNGVDSPRRDPLLWSIGEPARAKERLAPETMMVRELLLELRHPGVPNRPDQAYRRLKK